MKIVRYAFNPLRLLAVLAMAGGLLPAHAAWYDAPTVVKKIPVAQNIATNPHFINKAEDDSILLVNAQSEGDTAPTLLIDMKTLAIRQPVAKPSDGYGSDWKGGAVSAKLGLAFMGGGNSSETCAIATDGESWVKGIGLKPLSTSNGWRIDGLDFSVDSQYLYSNFYKDSTGGDTGQGKLLRWTYNASTGVLTLDREFATSLTRVRNISVYTVNGKELVYCGEGTDKSAAAKVIAIDVSGDTWTEHVVSDGITGLTGDITNVKLSNEDSANPVMYVLCSSGQIAVCRLAADGLSVAEVVKTFDAEALHTLAGGTTTAKFCSFEVTKDGKTAFIINRIDTKNANLCVLASSAYIESDGTQAINSGYHINSETKIEIDFQLTKVVSQARLFGQDGSGCGNTAVVYFGDSANNFKFGYGNTFNGVFLAANNLLRNTIVYDGPHNRGYMIRDGVEVASASLTAAHDARANFPMGIFAACTKADGTSFNNFAKMRLYGFRIYESDELVHNYIPAIKNGVAGLLDSVTGTFLYDTRATGAGTFVYGGDIETVDDDSYVESDGTSAINLGVSASPKLKIALDYALLEGNELQYRLLGQDTTKDGSPRFSAYINGSGQIALAGGTDTDFNNVSTGIATDTARHTVVIDNVALLNAYITGMTTNWTGYGTTKADCTKCATRPLALFGNTANDDGTLFNQCTKMKVYGLKIWSGDTLLRDLAPRCIDGTAGFEDRVTGKFFTCGGLTASANAPKTLSGPAKEGDAFIESDGSFYSVVDTRYFVKPTTKIEIDYQLASFVNSGIVMGGYGSAAGVSTILWCRNESTLVMEMHDGDHNSTANELLSPQTPPDLARHTAVFDGPNRHLTLKGADGAVEAEVDFVSSWTLNATANWPVLLFGSADNNAYGKSKQRSKVRIYGVKFYESGNLVLELTPAVKGGVAGFVDGNGNFYSGDGLTAGGNVQTIEDDPYVASPEGGCFFDTGYTVSSNTCIAIDYMPLEQHANQQFPFEAGARDGTHMFMRTYANGSAGTGDIAYFCGNTDNISLEVPFSPNVRRVLTLDAYKLKAKVETAGKTVREATIGAAGRVPEKSTSTLTLFRNATNNGNYMYGRLYGFKIYEEGALVRDYAPICQGGTYALVDKVTGKTLAKASSSKDFTGSTANSALNDAFFSAKMREEDAYIESDGTQGINLGYFTTPNTRYEIDFQMKEVAKQARPFGQATSALSAEFYIQDSLNFNFGVGDKNANGSWTGQPTNTQADDKRHVAVLDFANRECGYSGKGMYAFTAATVCSKTADFPMWLFAKGTNATGSYSNRAKMCLYAFRIYEAGVLVHEYLPYKNGDTVGLYDTVTGDVKTSSVAGSNAFKYGGGAGYGKYSGSKRVLITAPEDTEVRAKRSATLCAFAPGAAKYIWKKNGAVLAGATGETLSVLWTRSKVVDTYTVTPVFIIDGEEVPGTSASCTVEHLPLGLLLIVK